MVRILPGNALRRQERAVDRHERPGPRLSESDGGHVSRTSVSSGGTPWRLLEQPGGGGGGNTLLKLRLREIGGLRRRTPPSPNAAFCAENFRHFKLQEEFDVCADVDRPRTFKKLISSITVANDIILVIDWKGFCYAFRQNENGSISPYERDGRLQYFNHPGQWIETVFYNKINDSIIIVSSFNRFVHHYYMKVLPLQRIRNNNWDDRVPVFGSQTNDLPFFDDCNHIAVVSSRNNEAIHNVYEMNNYNIVHTIRGKIHSISKRPGVLTVGFRFTKTYLPIVVFSTEDWSVLKKMDYYNATLSRRLQFIQTHNESILMKERDKNVQIIDIWNHGNVTAIEQTKCARHFLCFDLTANNLLLMLDNDRVAICNPRGLQVSLLEDNEVTGYKPSRFLSNMFVTMDKNYAIFYSRKSIEKPREDATDEIQGSINICNTFNGKSILKIDPCNDLLT